jgi:hypothetical protein
MKDITKAMPFATVIQRVRAANPDFSGVLLEFIALKPHSE